MPETEISNRPYALCRLNTVGNFRPFWEQEFGTSLRDPETGGVLQDDALILMLGMDMPATERREARQRQFEDVGRAFEIHRRMNVHTKNPDPNPNKRRPLIDMTANLDQPTLEELAEFLETLYPGFKDTLQALSASDNIAVMPLTPAANAAVNSSCKSSFFERSATPEERIQLLMDSCVESGKKSDVSKRRLMDAWQLSMQEEYHQRVLEDVSYNLEQSAKANLKSLVDSEKKSHFVVGYFYFGTSYVFKADMTLLNNLESMALVRADTQEYRDVRQVLDQAVKQPPVPHP